MLTEVFPAENNSAPIFGYNYKGKRLPKDLHHHNYGQLMYCLKGIIEVRIAEKILVIPSANAIWIPENIPHAAMRDSPVNYYNLYFCTDRLVNLPKNVQVFSVSPFLHELIRKVLTFRDNSKKEKNVITVLIDQLNSVELQDYYKLSIPNNKTIKAIYEYIINDLSKPLLHQQVANKFAMSSKTLSRLFQKNIGMTFNKWKQQIKILEAISLLSEGVNNKQIVETLGYSCDSEFIRQFKKVIGKTPKQFKNSKINDTDIDIKL
ncbi:helix-turn-helix transcriptional regulator [Francisella sp. 19X1-34]|uniref:AraC family transcriptional regulator n=1 Tax=Francisella sp. 19X1-34 TaxID=3087177 RepID=UPI002E30E61B|nr:helix-turn-helix transcriptional regulator [Francisella sp. 19X1-34]MED7789692.1 helix-turn-helix transcriptional regulator [Francisella sp. 19X1-34]